MLSYKVILNYAARATVIGYDKYRYINEPGVTIKEWSVYGYLISWNILYCKRWTRHLENDRL